MAAMLADAPAHVLHAIAARGARIDATRAGEDPRTAGPSGDILAAAIDAAPHYAHGADGADATAVRVTRAIRTEGAASVRYADRPDVTGALVTLKMRVRHSLRSHAGAMSAPQIATDGAAARIEAARGMACETLRTEIRAYHWARARREDTGRIRARIVRILDAWGQDSAIIETARAEKWTIK